MSTTEKLLRLFRVDEQLGGLEGRLNAAQRFLDAQENAHAELQTKLESQNAQLRQLMAHQGNLEGEGDQIQARIDELRGKMNSSQTNKEYQALLVEVGKLTADKSTLDEQGLEHMEKCDEIRASIQETEAAAAEREKLRGVALQDRDKRASEIKDKVEALRGERNELASEVPGDVLSNYEARRGRFDESDEVMAPLVEQNKTMKRKE
eukprot:TRINITY_DN60800_c0_g1_i5.p3 TRINITY_DN60800_c0_g1~~TRINITY_DN60800_c0_g1_i5.p3  ORF type:complete len:207 (+),score=22.12 TRINITY_DN60800_c0_g1_i5:336-956(+)